MNYNESAFGTLLYAKPQNAAPCALALCWLLAAAISLESSIQKNNKKATSTTHGCVVLSSTSPGIGAGAVAALLLAATCTLACNADDDTVLGWLPIRCRSMLKMFSLMGGPCRAPGR